MTDRLGIILDDFINRLRELLNDGLLGVYLTGSIALGGYYDDKSDVDFTVVTEKTLDEKKINGLSTIHTEMLRKYPKSILEGHYITNAELGRTPDEISPVVTYNGGRVTRSIFGINMITWFTLKKHGVTAFGLAAIDLVFDAPTDKLLAYVSDNVKTYWTSWLKQTKKLFSIKGLYALTSAAIEWGVSGISRMYYTLSESDVISKDKSIEYALTLTPQKYHRILQDALAIRTGNGKRQYISPFKRRSDMIDYIGYLVDECNKLYVENNQKGNKE